MVKFHEGEGTVDVFVIVEDVFDGHDVSNMPASRSSRMTLSAMIPVDAPPIDILEDTENPDSDPFGGVAPLDIIEDDDCENICLPQSELVPSFALSGSRDEKHVKAAQQWQNNITGVGQRFESVTEFR